ncbi:hypothetical protein F4861DRAFT_283412 [Xylaria intraflava]|nr:hypothetical protein F4861DRAFT_283412 [Xylaria intraflava]
MTKRRVKPLAASTPEPHRPTAKKERTPPAVVAEWRQYMGTGSLDNWQRLMRDLGFETEFTSKTQCKKDVWVNIPDFLAAVETGQPVHHFPSRRELADYTRQERRFYPKRYIPKGDPLRQLLAYIVGGRPS